MCGIVYAKRKDRVPANKSLLKRYKNQRTRGFKGFGYVTIEDGYVTGVERFEHENDAEKSLEACTAHEILFHHRFPTSTPNYRDMTHPILVKNKSLNHNYYVVHNGVLRNEDVLKTKHEALGFKYTTDMRETVIVKTRSGSTETYTESFNDSESLAIELARYFDGKSESIDAVGTIAFVCLETDKKNKLLFIHYGRNSGNPLVVESNRDIFFIKSTGEGIDVPANRIVSQDYVTGATSTIDIPVGSVTTTERINAGFAKTYEEEDYTPGRLLTGHVRSPYQQKDLDWGQPSEKVIDISDAEEPIDGYYDNYEAYALSEDHLADIGCEIEALEEDIRKCKAIISGMLDLGSEDSVYDQAYQDECVSNLIEKKRQYVSLKRQIRKGKS